MISGAPLQNKRILPFGILTAIPARFREDEKGKIWEENSFEFCWVEASVRGREGEDLRGNYLSFCSIF
jgi:hypothetical protein